MSKTLKYLAGCPRSWPVLHHLQQQCLCRNKKRMSSSALNILRKSEQAVSKKLVCQASCPAFRPSIFISIPIHLASCLAPTKPHWKQISGCKNRRKFCSTVSNTRRKGFKIRWGANEEAKPITSEVPAARLKFHIFGDKRSYKPYQMAFC